MNNVAHEKNSAGSTQAEYMLNNVPIDAGDLTAILAGQSNGR
jgi:hypothetical protein